MNSQRNQVRWTLVGASAAGLACLALFAAGPQAAPLKVKEKGASGNEIEFRSAVFEAGSVTAIVVPNGGLDGDGEPLVLITALVEVEILFPDRARAVTQKYPVIKVLRQKDMDHFPGPLEMVNSDNEIPYLLLDDADQEKGLAQIRQAYEEGLELQKQQNAPGQE